MTASCAAKPSVVCSIFLVCSAACWGQVDLSLRQAIDQSLNNNPRLAVSQATIEDAQGQKRQAGLRPNPRLTLQTEDIRRSTSQLPFSFVNSTEDYVTVGQIIETSGKRHRRVDVADSVLQRTRLELDLTRRQVIASVSAAYWLSASTYQTQRLLEEALRTYDQDVNYIRNRVHEGVTAESELLRIQVEHDRVSAQVLTAKRDADQSIVNLYRAIGKSEFPPTRLTDPLEKIADIAIPDIARTLEARPEVQVAREAVAEAEANATLQKANGRPDPEALVGYKRNVGYDTLYGALQIDLPFSNRNQGNVASAAARLRSAQSSLQLTEANVRANLETAIRVYRDEQSIINQFPATLANTNETERLTRAAYREGAIDLLRFLDAERNRIQVQLDYYRALADFRKSIVNLNLASGASMSDGL